MIKSKKLLALVLALCLFLSVAVGCEKDPTPNPDSEGLEFTLNTDGTSYYVTGIGTCTDTDIVIPSEYNGKPVTSIGSGAFSGCTSLTSITIPDSVTSIGSGAFWGCTSLTSITIPNSVTSIDNSAFSYCTSLTSITIPDSVTIIGNWAFSGCSGLMSITIPDSVTSIGDGVFDDTAYYNNSANWTDGVLYIGNHLIEAKTSLSGTYNIKEGTKCIAAGAFSGCKSLTSITIPDSVTSIGEYAFFGIAYYDNIDNWDNGVLYIGNHLIRVESSILKEFSVKAGTKCLADGAFSVYPMIDAATATLVYQGCTNLTSVTIPDSVTIIGDFAFKGCESLTSITIPDSVTRIGNSAFSYCTSLTSINFEGTKAQWNAISKGAYWNSSTGSYTIYCTDAT